VEPQPLGELIVEILQKHVNGIHFREWNAGTMLDEHMLDQGFDISVYVHREVWRGAPEHGAPYWRISDVWQPLCTSHQWRGVTARFCPCAAF
jgi:hypothetical protein